VELPGVSDLDKVKAMIQSTARLEIHAVVGDGSGFADEASALASVNGALPPDEEIVPGSGNMATGSDAEKVFIVERAPVVSGSDFRSADPSVNSNTGQRTVHFTLTDEAGNRFWDYTSANVGKYMAIVMGNRIREVAVIKSGIRDSGEIEGAFTEDEVTVLSKMLRTGALPASLIFLEDRTVGASLGADSIREGVTAAIVGVLVVMALSLIHISKKVMEPLAQQNAPLVDEGLKYLTMAVDNRPNYDDAMQYLNLIYRNKADVDFGNPCLLYTSRCV